MSAMPHAPFPPPEALSAATAVKPFQPQVWASLQPPPATSLHAFASRIRLFDSTLPGEPAAKQQPRQPPANLPEILTQALTHQSFLKLLAEHAPEGESSVPRTNQEWEVLGNHLMGLFAAEFVHASWPHLPTRIVKAAVSAYVGPQTCADVAKEWGLGNMVRWTRIPKEGSQKAVNQQEAYASAVRSIVALTYQHLSIAHARALVHKYFLSREVDLRPLIKFRNPTQALQETVKAYGREKPVSRLLKETGRYSISPMYVVGVFSGADKLGEGFGSSLRMAEFRASEDALRRLYLTKTPPQLLSLPTSTFDSTASAEPFSELSKWTTKGYAPGELGECEVLYGSADKQMRGKPFGHAAPATASEVSVTPA